MDRRQRFQVAPPQRHSTEYQILHDPWEARLKELEERWVRNTPENADAFCAQINEAWVLAYEAVWQYRKGSYTADERSDAALALRADLIRYDPQIKSLVSYVRSCMCLRLKGAWARGLDIEYDACDEKEDPQQWAADLAQIGQCFPEDPQERTEWAGTLSQIIFAHYCVHIANMLKTRQRQKEEMEGLKAYLVRFEPDRCSLMDYVQNWVDDVLKGDKKQIREKGAAAISLDTPVGEAEGESMVDMIASGGPSVERQADVNLVVQQATEAMARVLNFQLMMNPRADLQEEHRANRMCFTERVLYLAKFSRLPDVNRKDLFHALLRSYLCHFARMPENGIPANLAALPFKTMEQILDPDSPEETWKTPLQWSAANDFLPGKVAISFLQRHYGQTVNDRRVNTYRSEYYKTLQGLLNRQYSAADIRDILNS